MNEVSGRIIGAAIEVHRALGPGLLESAYQECSSHELTLRGISFLRQLFLPVEYKGVKVDCSYRVDFLVDQIKSVSSIEPIHEAQLLTYMKPGQWKLGLLINFNVALLKDGVRRLVLCSLWLCGDQPVTSNIRRSARSAGTRISSGTS